MALSYPCPRSMSSIGPHQHLPSRLTARLGALSPPPPIRGVRARRGAPAWIVPGRGLSLGRLSGSRLDELRPTWTPRAC
eukprot:3148945-Rhodomonas_salina.1